MIEIGIQRVWESERTEVSALKADEEAIDEIGALSNW